MEELGLDYGVRLYKRRKDMSAPDDLKTVHPLGKSPIVEDLDGPDGRVVLVETGAIVEYVTATRGNELGVPSRLKHASSYRQYLHYAEGSLMPILFTSLVVSKIPLFGRLALKRVRTMLDVHLNFIEQELSTREWFAGTRFTAADIMMSFPLEAAQARGLLRPNHSATVNWLTRIHARPAYQQALARGGPYALGPSLP